MLGTVIDPELGSDIVSLGMVPGVVQVDADGVVHVTVKLTIGGCPLRADIKRAVEQRVGVHPGVREVRIEWGEMTPEERSEVMLKARWNARQQRRRDPGARRRPRVLAIASGKGGVGKSSVTVNLAVALGPPRAAPSACWTPTSGASRCRGLLGMTERMEAARVEGSERPLIIPNELAVGAGRLKVVSTGFLVEEDTALMWRGLMLTKAVEQFLRDVRWGELDDLLIDMPPGTGDVQMGLARLLPRTDMVIVTTPALAAQKVAQRAADMARRSFVRVVGVIENMTDFTCEHGDDVPAVRRRWRGRAGRRRSTCRCSGRSRWSRRSRPAAMPVARWRWRPATMPARRRRRSPPLPTGWTRSSARRPAPDGVDMAGCSARLLDAVEVALGPRVTTG